MRKRNSITDVKAGTILLASPFEQDQLCKMSMLMVLEIDENLTTGIFLNLVSNMDCRTAIEDFPLCNAPLYYGGPDNLRDIILLHRLGNRLEGSTKIAEGLYVGGNLEALYCMMDADQITNNDVRFYAGNTSWIGNELSSQIDEDQWIINNYPEKVANIIFSQESSDEKWKDSVDLLSVVRPMIVGLTSIPYNPGIEN